MLASWIKEHQTELEEILERLEVRTYQAVRANPGLKIGQIPKLLSQRDEDQAQILELMAAAYRAGEAEGGKNAPSPLP